MRILLVEDDPMIGESVRAALRQEGYAVDWDAALREMIERMAQQQLADEQRKWATSHRAPRLRHSRSTARFGTLPAC